MPWGLDLDPCVALAARELLLIWLGVGSLAILVGPLLWKLPAKLKRAVVIGLVAFASVLGAQPAYAAPPNYPGGGCAWMNDQGWPCWIIEAMWCPCTWDDPPPPPG